MDVKFPSLFLAQCTLGSEANMGKGKVMVVSDVALTSDDEVSTNGFLRGGMPGASCALPPQTSSLKRAAGTKEG
jgi:hypothetical protein